MPVEHHQQPAPGVVWHPMRSAARVVQFKGDRRIADVVVRMKCHGEDAIGESIKGLNLLP